MIQERGYNKCVSLLSLFVFSAILFATGCTSSAPTSLFISPQIAAMGAGQTMQFTPIVSNDSSTVTWTSTGGSIDANGNFTAPAHSATITVTAALVKNPKVTATAKVNVVAPGSVTPTANVQVASYTIAPAGPGNVSVQFGTDTTYGLTTWTEAVPAGGGAVNLLVAGMRGSTLYHMRGVVQFADGSQYNDVDQTFATGSVPAAQLPSIAATTTPGMTPQSGVELLDLILGPPTVAEAVVTDLAGNIIWTYIPGPAVPAGATLGPIKIMPNGNLLLNFAVGNAQGEALSSVIQQIDLTGKVMWQMTSDQLNQALASATCAGCNVTILGTHHDFAILPNGHLIVMANTEQVISGTTVMGDVLIDLDQNHNPVWLWNEFDHLDINRRPYLFPDWTHTNAVLYSPADGNLIISLRHQNWLLKVDYANGAGAGDIIWHLGYQGDFTLMGGTDPTDWFYAQHGPSFTTTNTTGQFGLTLFDNGDDRFFPSGQVSCPPGSATSATCYSTVQVFNLDETAKTATFSFHMTAPFYSYFGGDSQVLQNGNVEFCESAEPTGLAGDVFEVATSGSGQTVWHLKATGQYVYRGQRIPSLYPGVQW